MWDLAMSATRVFGGASENNLFEVSPLD